jgi:hypothetical protein
VDEVRSTLGQLRPTAGPSPAITPPPRLRRCSFRRLTLVERRPPPVYDVECLYRDRTVPIPLGDIESARPICGSCLAGGIFRPDEE